MVGSVLLAKLFSVGTSPFPGVLAWVSRMDSKVLESPDRMKILQIVHERPGVSVTDLSHRLQMTWGQLNYHLGRLEQVGLLHTVKAGRHRLVFPDRQADDAPEDRALLLERTARALALLILENPRVSVTDLVRMSRESPRVVYYHVKKLLDAGLVTSSSGVHHRGLSATPRLAQILSSV